MDTVKVAIRVRALLQKERQASLKCQWNHEGDQIWTGASNPYTFDRIFGETDETDDLFADICKPIVDSALGGFNGTIFAYGQSSSGKTHTMSGSNLHPGIISLATEEIFSSIANIPDRQFLIRIGYMEIYNERVNDLLSYNQEHNLKLQEDTDHNIQIGGLTEEVVQDISSVYSILKRGDAKRQTAETKQNDRSSRSHSILRFVIESHAVGHEDDAVKVSNLHFVDLAGSEKANENSGDRFREGCSINKSLFTLGMVIRNLTGDGSQRVSFRESKLTRILQNALGGNSKTAIICTIAPANVEQSDSTLKFASRAKTITNAPHVNEVISDSAMLKKYRHKINDLKEQIKRIQGMEKAEFEKKLAEYQRQQSDIVAKLQGMFVSVGPSMATDLKNRKIRRETWCPGKQRDFRGFSPPNIQPLPKMEVVAEDEDSFQLLDNVTMPDPANMDNMNVFKPDETIQRNPDTVALFELQDKHETLLEELQTKENELAEIEQYQKDELLCREETIAELTQRVAHLEATQTSLPWLEEELMKTQTERNKLRQQVEAMHVRLGSVEDGTGLSQKSKQLEASETKNADLNSELNVQKCKYEFHIEQMKKQLETYTIMLEEKGVNSDDIKTRVSVNYDKGSTSSESDQDVSLKGKYSEEVSQLRDEIDMLVIDLEQEKNVVKALREQHETEMDRQRDIYRKDLDEAKDEISIYHELLEKVKQEKAAEQNSLTQDQTVITEMKENHEKQIGSMKQELAHLETEKRQLLEQHETEMDQQRDVFRIDLEEARDEISMYQELLEKVRQDSLANKVAEQNCQGEIEMSQLKEVHQTEIESMKRELEECYRNELEKSKSELGELQMKYDLDLASLNQQLNATNKVSEMEKQTLEFSELQCRYESNIRSLQEQLDILRNKQTCMESDSIIIDEDSHAQCADSDEVMENPVESKDISATHDQYRETSEQNRDENSESSEIAEKKEEDKESVEECGIDVNESDKTIEELKEVHQAEIEQMKEEFRLFVENHFDTEKDKLLAQETEIENLKEELRDFDTAKQDIERLSEELRCHKEGALTVEKSDTVADDGIVQTTAAELKEKYELELESLREQLVKADRERSTGSAGQLNVDESEICKLKELHQNELDALMQELTDRFQTELEAVDVQHKEDGCRYQDEIESLTEQIELLNNKVSVLENDETQKEEFRDLELNYQREIESLKQQLELLRNHTGESCDTDKLLAQEEELDSLREKLVDLDSAKNEVMRVTEELESYKHSSNLRSNSETGCQDMDMDEIRAHYERELEIMREELITEKEEAIAQKLEREEIQAAVDRLQAQLNNSNETCAQHERKLQEWEIGSKQRISTYESTVEESHSMLMNMKAQLVQLEDDLAILETSNKKLKHDKLELLNDKEGSEKMIETLKCEAELMATELDASKLELDSSSLEVQSLKIEIETLSNVVDSSQSEVQSYKAGLEASETELETSKLEVEELKTMLESSKSEVRNLSIRLSSSSNTADASEECEDLSRTDLELLKSEIVSLKNMVISTETKNESLKTELESCSIGLESSKADVESLKAELVSRNIESSDAHVRSLQAELDSCNIDLESLKAELDSRNIDLESMKAELDSRNIDLESMKAELDSRNTDLESMKAELDSRNIDLESLKAELDSRNIDLESMKAELDSRNIDLESMKAELDSRNIDLESMKAELDSRNIDLESLKAEIDSRNIDLESMKAELDSRNIDLESMKAELDSRNTDLESLKAALDTRNIDLESLKAALDSPNIDLESLEAELDSRNIEIESMKANMESLKNMVISAETEVESLKAELHSRNRELEISKTEVVSMKNMLDSSQMVASLKNMLETGKSEEKLSKSDVDSSKSEVEYLKSKLDASETHVELLRTKLETSELSVETLRVELESSKIETESMRTQLEAVEAESVENMQKLTSKYQDESSKTELQELKQKLVSSTIEVTSLKLQLDAATLEVEALKREFESISSKSEGGDPLRESNTESHRSMLVSSNAEMEALKAQIDELKTELASVQEDRYQLQKGRELQPVRYMPQPQNVDWEKKWREFCQVEKFKRIGLWRELNTVKVKLTETEAKFETVHQDAVLEVEGNVLREEKYSELDAEANKLNSQLEDEREITQQLRHKLENLEKNKDKFLTEDHPCKYKMESFSVGEKLKEATKKYTLRKSQYEETIMQYEEQISKMKNRIRQLQNMDNSYVFNQAASTSKEETSKDKKMSESVLSGSSMSGGIIDSYKVCVLEAKIKKLEQELEQRNKKSSAVKQLEPGNVDMSEKLGDMKRKFQQVDKENLHPMAKTNAKMVKTAALEDKVDPANVSTSNTSMNKGSPQMVKFQIPNLNPRPKTEHSLKKLQGDSSKPKPWEKNEVNECKQS